MNHFPNKQLHKIVLVLVLCFGLILGIGGYQTFHQKNVESIKTEVVEEKKAPEETKSTSISTKKKSTKKKTKKTSTKKKTTKKKTTTKTTKKTSTTTTKKVTKKVTKKKTTVKKKSTKKKNTKKKTTSKKVSTISVHVQVIGVNKVFVNRDITVNKGSSVFDVLKKTGLSTKTSGFSSMLYVRSINGLAEKDYGPSSGWMYSVNGVAPNKGSAVYYVKDNDNIKWYYVNYE